MTSEQQARDLLEKIGVPDAQNRTAGDLTELANLFTELNQAKKALRACHAYFIACGQAWMIDKGRIANEAGHLLVQAKGLDELANEAGELVGRFIIDFDSKN